MTIWVFIFLAIPAIIGYFYLLFQLIGFAWFIKDYLTTRKEFMKQSIESQKKQEDLDE